MPADSHSETLFLHLLAVAPPPIQFAGETLRHTYQLERLGMFLRGVGVSALAAGALLSGKQLVDAYRLDAETERLRSETAGSRAQYAAVVKTFPGVPVDNETLKSLIGRYLAEARRSLSPTPFYRDLGRVLEGNPAIELSSLEWKIGGAEPAGGEAAKTEAGSLRVSEDSERLVVRGTLTAAPGTDRRRLVSLFDRFVDELRSDEKWHVDVLQRPFEIASGIPLRSGDAALDNSASRMFSVQITRKIAP